MSSAKANVQAFHTWHSSRTYNPGHPQLDPWMRDVLLNLQLCLNSLAKQIDENTDKLDQLARRCTALERFAHQVEDWTKKQPKR